MLGLQKKVLSLLVISSIMSVGVPLFLPAQTMPVNIFAAITPKVQAYSALEALVSGGAAMAYVSKVIKEMDDTDKGQKESLERIKAKTGYYDNPAAQQRVQTILTNLAKSPLVKRSYVVYVNPEDDFNAFMTIGRVMSVNKGALDKLDDNELAYVMSHEISHGEHKDIVNGLKKQVTLSTAVSVASAGAGGTAILGNIFTNYMNNQVFTMSQEEKADELGFKILSDSQYNIGGAAAAMAVLRETYGDHYREGIGQVLAPNNHPKTSDRVLKNEKRMALFSKNHVNVKGATVYVNGQEIYSPAASGRYTGEERAYLMAGKLARLYSSNAIAPEWARADGSVVMIGNVSIITAPDYATAQNVAATLNSAFGKTGAKS